MPKTTRIGNIDRQYQEPLDTVPVITLTSTSNTIAIDGAAGSIYELAALNENTTLANPTNLPTSGRSKVYNISIDIDGTGGYTFALDTKWKLNGTVDTTAGAKNIISAVYHSGTDELRGSINTIPA